MTWTLLEDTPACGSCAYWCPGRTATDEGEFRRFPPTLDADSVWTWPATIDEDWCGEYRPGGAQ